MSALDRTLGLTIALTVAAASASAAQAEDALRFCVSEDNLPLAEAMPPSGVEVEFARMLAGRLGREARFEWFAPGEHNLGQAVLEGRCDAALGAIVDARGMAHQVRVPGLALSLPYYEAGYLLLRRASASPVRRLAELGTRRVAVEMQSIPVYTLRHRGLRVHALPDAQAVIEAIADGRAEYGYLWGPVAAWSLRARTDVVIVREFDPVERWRFAVALPEQERELREALNETIVQMIRSGSLEEIFSRYGVPYLAPVPPPLTVAAPRGGGGWSGVVRSDRARARPGGTGRSRV